MFATLFAPLLLAATAALLTWLVQRNKTRAEIEKIRAETMHIHLENLEKASAIWQEIADGLRNEVEKLTLECRELKTQVIELKSENNHLRQEVVKLEKTIENKSKIITNE